ncbi:MAG: hypothetical protein K0U41_01245 [Gammaproteobacteria bacterium]|nr:hypothetical protein [Gammaproteobacteria bacterium]
MIDFLKDIKNRVTDILKTIWTTKLGLISWSVALGVVYLAASIIAGEARNPIWLVWWALIGSLSAALSGAISQKNIERLKQQLDQNISNPPGFKYVVKTIDGADIGEIAETAYLTAKFEADTCYSTKILQGLNTIWMAWSIVVKTLAFMPVLLVSVALCYRFFVADNSLSEITLGQILESNLLVITFLATLLLMIAVSFRSGLKYAPGYKNFYELKLRRLLSKHLPNIANANGFSVTEYKIELEVKDALRGSFL